MTVLHDDNPPKPAVLLVEDDRDTRESTLMLWADEGSELLGCASAEEALEALARRPFDLVITDISLPGMTGVEFASQVIARWPEVQLVFCSGHFYAHGVDLAQRRLQSLPKPIDSKTFRALLAGLRRNMTTPAG